MLIYHFIGFPYLIVTTFSKDVRLSWPKQIFCSLLFIAYPDFLIYLLLFWRMTGWVDLNFFILIQICISTLELTSGRGHPLEYRPNFFLRNSFISTRIEALASAGHPKGSSNRVQAELFFRIWVSLHWILNLSLGMTSGWDHPLKYRPQFFFFSVSWFWTLEMTFGRGHLLQY